MVRRCGGGAAKDEERKEEGGKNRSPSPSKNAVATMQQQRRALTYLAWYPCLSYILLIPSHFSPLDRPCNRCVKRNLGDTCQDGVRKKAKYLRDIEDEGKRKASSLHVESNRRRIQTVLPDS